MTKEQETQQAQTIAEAKERIQWAANCRHVLTYKEKRKELALVAWVLRKVNRSVDSQAQKIEQLEKDFNLAATIAQKHKDDLDTITKEYEDYKIKSGEAIVDLIDKNNEQAAELRVTTTMLKDVNQIYSKQEKRT